MNNIFAGVVVAVVVVGAFYLGTQHEWDVKQGPAEEVGEAIDEGIKDTERALEDATD